MRTDDGREEIVAGRATQFDPELVDAFLARERSFIAIHEGHTEAAS